MPKADFSTWDRATLEAFARQAADENRELRDQQKHVHLAWREAVKEAERLRAQLTTCKSGVTP